MSASGLVGPNGAGKTTLLRIVAGRDEADRGTVTRRRHLSLGLLSQEAHFDEAFMAAPDLRAAVRHGAAHLEKMAAELEHLEHGGHAAGNRYADLQHRFEVLGGYTLDQRVDESLSGLGFARDEWLRPPTALSGGQQTRAALARLVVADPDLLLLDEPTNHLDINAIEWLEEHLRRRSGALLVASHDRAFLDATVARVWELRDRRLTVFRGDYSSYHRQRVERDLRAEKDAESQSDAMERETELVQRYRSQRKHTKMHEHEARLEKLKADRIEAPRKSSRTLRLHGHSIAGGPVRSGELVVRMDDMAVGYLPGRGALNPDGTEAPEPVTVARAPFLAAQRGERIGIVGPNGAGKTTLLRTIAGDLPPLDGMIVFGHQVQPGYLAQLRDAAIPGATVLDAIMEAIPVTPGEARGYLARFLFRGDDVFKEVRALSGGERSRLELALLGILPANLLLLDEPTNHLDIAAREAIEAFLAETPGTLLVVSHDRRLLETICERLWVVDEALAVPFDGGYRAWRQAVADGWTVAAEASRRQNRLRPGTPGSRPDAASAPASTGRKGGSTAPVPVGVKAAPPDDPRRASEAAPQAVQGGLPAPPRGGRRRAGAPRPAQEPARAGHRHAVDRRQLRRDAPRDERARGRGPGPRRGGGRMARARGAGAVTAVRRTIRIGITGPIGCGKSQVARWLAARGARVVDADLVAREVTAPGTPVHAAILRRFGASREHPRRHPRPRGPRAGRVRGPGGAAGPRGTGAPGGPAPDPRGDRGGRGFWCRGRGHRGDQARGGWARRPLRRGVARGLRSGGAARAAPGARHPATRRRPAGRRPDGTHREAPAVGDPRAGHVRRGGRDAGSRGRGLRGRAGRRRLNSRAGTEPPPTPGPTPRPMPGRDRPPPAERVPLRLTMWFAMAATRRRHRREAARPRR